MSRTHKVIVIGAGVGGLVAAGELAGQGCDVTVLERGTAVGGKMRETHIGDAAIDAGPTVLTMRWVFDELFDAAGVDLARHLELVRAGVLARHAWAESPTLDLHAELEESTAAVGDFAGRREAQAFRDFHTEARRIYQVLQDPFLRGSRPTPLSLTARIGLARLGDLFAIRPFETLWHALSRHFTDPRLQQLFGRYATYCGSSPYAAPATLMLVAHVEQDGVWLVRGGMHRVALALAELARARGAVIRCGADVAAIEARHGRACGVRLRDGTALAADAVVCNADVGALAAGLFGSSAVAGLPQRSVRQRSLSAVTWAVHARTSGLPLERHNVFFSADYRAEFDAIFAHGRLPQQPTVYVCAQDRAGAEPLRPGAPERLLCLVNAPATGDGDLLDTEEFDRCEARTFLHLRQLGLTIERDAATTRRTTPWEFNQMFPGTGGALYGQASHGWRASFQRPGSRTKVPGLYLAGGSAHPGPGVPMAALSGRQAAASLAADLASTSRSSRVVMPGGISTR